MRLFIRTKLIHFLDENANTVYYREIKNIFDFQLEKNGNMYLATPQNTFVMNSTFRIIDSVTYKNGLINDGHERMILPNGNMLFLCREDLVMNYSKHPSLKGRTGSDTAISESAVLQERDTKNNVVF